MFKPRLIEFPKEDAERRRVRAQRLVPFLAGLDTAKAWDLIVQPRKRKRSNQQNKYLRGVACALISETVGYEPDEVHEYLCGTYFGWKTQACPKTPSNPKGIKDVPVRTTTTDENGERDVLNKQDFWDFVEFVQRFGAKHGILIPDPDPDYAFRHHNKAA